MEIITATLPVRIVHMRHPESEGQRRETDGLPMRGLVDRTMGITCEGLSVAHRVGVAMLDKYGPFDAIIYSSYRRTKLGALAVMRSYPVELQTRVRLFEDPLLDERDLGDAFGLDADQLARRFPEFVRRRVEFGDVETVFPRGENMIAMFKRISRLIDIWLPRLAGKQACFMGHFGTYFGFLDKFAPIPHEDLPCMFKSAVHRPKNCSLLVLEPHPSGKEMEVRAKNLMLAD